VCAYKEQYPGANQQNIANFFLPFMGQTHPSVGTMLEIFSEKKINGRTKYKKV
jgi:hypothetical protein